MYSDEEKLSDPAPRWASKRSGQYRSRLVVLLALALALFVFIRQTQVTSGEKSIAVQSADKTAFSFGSDPLLAAAARSKNAFCVFLDLDSASKKEDGSDDRNFIGTRMLIYQLLHDSVTKTKIDAAFVVLVSDTVNEIRRQRLRDDGAVVVQSDKLANDPSFDWIKPSRSRWAHVIDKLHALKLTMFDKILLFDSNTVVVRRLDDIFTYPESVVLKNRENSSQVKDDEAPQPSEYLMAGNSGPYSLNHSYPSPRGNKLNAGFVLFKPTMEMYNYYLSVARIADRFNPSSPEQNLWNYAHRLDGNMPWVQVDPDWTANTPNYGDYENGIASFQEKWWACEKELKLRDVLLKSRWKMEGYWLGKERMQGKSS